VALTGRASRRHRQTFRSSCNQCPVLQRARHQAVLSADPWAATGGGTAEGQPQSPKKLRHARKRFVGAPHPTPRWRWWSGRLDRREGFPVVVWIDQGGREGGTIFGVIGRVKSPHTGFHGPIEKRHSQDDDDRPGENTPGCASPIIQVLLEYPFDQGRAFRWGRTICAKRRPIALWPGDWSKNARIRLKTARIEAIRPEEFGSRGRNSY